MPPLDLTAPSVEITRALCDIPSVSGGETALADAIEAAVSAHTHLEVIRDGDTIVASSSPATSIRFRSTTTFRPATSRSTARRFCGVGERST